MRDSDKLTHVGACECACESACESGCSRECVYLGIRYIKGGSD